MTDREQLIELVTWALRQDPAAREWGGLTAEATDRVDAFLVNGALPARLADREEPMFNAIPADLPEGVSFILAPERLPNEMDQQFARRCVVGRTQAEPATREEQ